MQWIARRKAQKILDKDADYLLAVKGNQGNLNKAFKDYFKISMLQKYDGSSYSTQEISRERKETRLALVNEDLSVLGDLTSQWPELKSMRIVVSIRQTDIEAATEDDLAIRFYISSKALDARTLLESTRSHWLVESMHWSLDTAFREDNSRIRIDERAESFKASVKRKIMKCAMNESYLLVVLVSLST